MALVYRQASPLDSALPCVQMPAVDEKTHRVRGHELSRVRKAHETLDTRDKVAVAAGTTSKSVQRAEQGHASFETLEKIALALGVHPWDYWIPLGQDFGRPAGDAPANSDAPPAWFVQAHEQQGAALREMREMLEVLINR